MKALYRKYRPLKLEDVVGQEQVTDPLMNAIKQGKISHAYLFTGPRGTGKTTVARIFAHLINGFNYELEDDYVDIVEIDGASNRGVDNIRDIREKAMIAPSVGKYKVYIIDEVHMLTKEAFNALLKTLEEPPKHVVFIMATTDAYKVPVTITSRAQTYTFKLATLEVISEHLQKIAEKEGIKIEPAALEVVAKKGGGSFRDSLSLLDQISTISEGEITLPMVEKTMGLPSTAMLGEILDAYISGDVVKITTVLKELLSTGVKAETLTEELIAEIIAKPKPELIQLLDKLVEVKAPFAEARLLAALVASSRPFSERTAQPETPENQNRSLLGSRPAGERVAVLRGPSRESSFNAQEMHTRKDGKDASVPPMSKFQKFMAERNRMRQEPAEETRAEGRSTENSEINSKLSAIMGGEVESYGGGNPF